MLKLCGILIFYVIYFVWCSPLTVNDKKHLNDLVNDRAWIVPQRINNQVQVDERKEEFLPIPTWIAAPHALSFDSCESFDVFFSVIEAELKEQLVYHLYDTISNLLGFYKSYKQQSTKNIYKFYKSYIPIITPERNTCVGLAMDLLLHLKEFKFTHNKTECFYLVSAEEYIKRVDDYCSMELPITNIVKEHVAVAAKITISGRNGLLLLDPGYHVGRVVIIMTDQQFPHTGWFTQSQTDKCIKKYCYKFHTNNRYVEWHCEEIRNGRCKFYTNLFYVEKQFTSAVDVTERRNLVYGFRSLLRRDADGQIIAGIYFGLKANARFTLIRKEGGKRVESSVSIDYFKSIVDEDEMTEELIRLCGEGLRLPDGHLRLLLLEIVQVIEDEEFLNQIEEIDCVIDSEATF